MAVLETSRRAGEYFDSHFITVIVVAFLIFVFTLLWENAIFYSL